MISVTPIILRGGSGTRLWPLSRTGFPKQFLRLTGGDSLLRQAAIRLSMLGDTDIQLAPPLIVAGEDHRFLASEQLREIGIEAGCALLEPAGRNTAPALTLAALTATECEMDPVLVVTPADQAVADSEGIVSARQLAVREVAESAVVILGVRPDRPETGCGYIQIDKSDSGRRIQAVKGFVEKPSEATARIYLDEGGYYWNAGSFVHKASM